MHSSHNSDDSFSVLDKSEDGSSSTREFDISIKEKIKVSRNNLILNTFISIIFLLILVLPYFLPWFHEESTVKSFDGKPKHIYFFLHKVWVPLPIQSFTWGT